MCENCSFNYTRCPNCSNIYSTDLDKCPKCGNITVLDENVDSEPTFNIND